MSGKISLYDYQLDAVKKMKNGCILCGGVGSGKSRTSLAYYFVTQGGSLDPYKRMKSPKDLYIITTARKRDTNEWLKDMAPFLLSSIESANSYSNKVIVDSWNNVAKYKDVKNSFFIFDEQRVVGYGKWSKSFIQIARSNNWILLTATPGDTWTDYMPVFIANGFYRNKSDFTSQHVIYSYYSKYPKIQKFVNVGKLIKHKSDILITMDYSRPTQQHKEDLIVDYDDYLYDQVFKDRWNVFDKEPIENISELLYLTRKVVNSDLSRIEVLKAVTEEKRKVIVFYNYDYELDLIKSYDYYSKGSKVVIAEWNGHAHEPIPKSEAWMYLVQYTAGAEGWNCIETDTIIFFSQNYSYKTMVQASGRIDRLNTPFTDLYYYTLKSKSPIDRAISRALQRKKNFNERNFLS